MIWLAYLAKTCNAWVRLKVEDEGSKFGKQSYPVNVGIKEVKFNNAGPYSFHSFPLTLMYKIEMCSMRLVSNGICMSFNLSLTSSLTWLWRRGLLGSWKWMAMWKSMDKFEIGWISISDGNWIGFQCWSKNPSFLSLGYKVGGIFGYWTLIRSNSPVFLREMPLVVRSAMKSSVKNSSRPCSLASFYIVLKSNQNLNLTCCMEDDSIARVILLGDALVSSPVRFSWAAPLIYIFFRILFKLWAGELISIMYSSSPNFFWQGY